MPSNSMNVINYNRSLLSQRDRFKTKLGGYNFDEKTQYNLPKASSKHLNNIKRRMQREYQIWLVKVIVMTVLGFMGLILLLILITS